MTFAGNFIVIMMKIESTDRMKPGYKQTEIGVIPVDWGIFILGHVCDVRDGSHDSPRYQNSGVRFITSKNIVGGHLELDNADYISDIDAEIEALEAKLAKTKDIKQGMMQELLTGRTRLI